MTLSILHPAKYLDNLWRGLRNVLVIKTDPNFDSNRHYETQIQRLAETSDHLLDDIGLSATQPREEAQDQIAGAAPDLHTRHFW